MTDPNRYDAAHRAEEDEDSGPIGIFPNWTAVYVSVVVFTLVMIVLLAWLTSALNFSVAS